MNNQETQLDPKSTRGKIHNIIYESDTFGGKFFDIAILVLIVISVLVIMLESVNRYDALYHRLFLKIEWALTIIFTIEYGLRLYSVKKPMKYATSFYGIIDLLATLPTYLSLLFAGSQFFLIIRVMRLLRVFRIFKLVRFIDERNILANSLRASWYKISYFLFFIILTVCIVGTLMYLIEGGHPESGFDNIPISIYWCIVTLTTVGYGDISPTTPLGQLLASVVMILGYAVIAVPTGIVTTEFVKRGTSVSTHDRVCSNCSAEGHFVNADYCYDCGARL